MSKELMKVDPGQGSLVPVQMTPMEMIAAAARDQSISVEKLERLVDLQRQMEAHQAERAYIEAMNRLQPRLPVIKKRGKIEFKGQLQSRFAKYEHIDEAIRPLLAEEGFTLSFDSRTTDKGTIYYGILQHVFGHKETRELALPPDTSGSKNAIQALGSTFKYAQRYLLGALLNIVTVDVDDDANSFGGVSDAQLKTLNELVKAGDLDAGTKSRFLNFLGVQKIEQTKASDYDRAVKALASYIREKQKAPESPK